MFSPAISIGLLLVLGLHLLAQSTDDLGLFTNNLHTETQALDLIVDVIRQADADIVALQEVTPQALNRFRTEFAGEYPFIVYPTGTRPRRWLVLLSRYETIEEQYYVDGNRGLLRAVINVDGRLITVFNVHAPNPWGVEAYDDSERSEQITFLLEQAAQETHPVIMLGDFNTEEWSDDYSALTTDYVDAFRNLHEDDLGTTFPDYSTASGRRNPRLPTWSPLMLRLDYVFHNPVFTTLEAQVWPEPSGSDHRPLFVRLALPPT